MAYSAAMFAALEENGYMDTNTGLISRVAKHLANSPNETINTAEFWHACIACSVDPDSFTQSDLDELQSILNRIT